MERFDKIKNDAYRNAIANDYYKPYDELDLATSDNIKANSNAHNISMVAIMQKITEEISEASIAVRNGKYIPPISADFYNPEYFNSQVKNRFETELADAMLVILSFCEKYCIDILYLMEVVNFHNVNRGKLNGKLL